MRSVILNLAISFDGFIEGPNGELGWLVKDQTVDLGDILTEILSDKDIIFYGRIAYEKWGNIQPDENSSKKIKDAYHLMHTKTKYVFSTTMKDDGTDAIFINSNLEEKVRELKQEPGKDIWLYGGAKIATTFFNLNLIDELRLAVHPIILGSGKPLFQKIEHTQRLKLIEVKDYKSGIILVKYKVENQF